MAVSRSVSVHLEPPLTCSPLQNVQHNNAQNAVLFEAINLAIHLDPESKVVTAAARLLGRFILAKETNVRYLGLDSMAHLAACSESLEPIKMHQDTIIQSLKDRDISVRRRGLDLLYSMCDTTNAKIIVGELLQYLQTADYNLREEMVLKIAILTERFATEVSRVLLASFSVISQTNMLIEPSPFDNSMSGMSTSSFSSFQRPEITSAPRFGTESFSWSPTTRTCNNTLQKPSLTTCVFHLVMKVSSKSEAIFWENLVISSQMMMVAVRSSSSMPCTARSICALHPPVHCS